VEFWDTSESYKYSLTSPFFCSRKDQTMFAMNFRINFLTPEESHYRWKSFIKSIYNNLILYDPAGVGYALPLFIKHSLTSLKSLDMEYNCCCRKNLWMYPIFSFNPYKIAFATLDRWVKT
jgi:hypothetical protein